MEADPAVVTRLRAAGCVWAEDEAALLASAANSRAELDAMVQRRAGGEPLEQVIGWAEFGGLRIFVDPGVFVPRRRSEYLVAVAAALAAAVPPVIADLCCGTGALGLAVAVRFGRPSGAGGPSEGNGPRGGDGAGQSSSSGGALTGRAGFAELHAADLDPAAVACARRNVEPAGGRVYHGDLFAPLPDSLRGRVGVLICNAPYVPTADIAFLPSEAREHEAPMALDGGPDGLAVLRRAADGAAGWLAPGGVLLVETSERQAPLMAAVMTAAGLTPQVHGDDESGATVVTGVTASGSLDVGTKDSGSLGGPEPSQRASVSCASGGHGVRP
jgi:release factor glutamine methyltransferase